MPTLTMSRLHQDDEGAITVLTGLSMMVVLLALAFAIDVGSLVLGDRDLQGVVDTAALDAVVGLGPLATDDPEARVQELALLSAVQNTGWSGHSDELDIVTTIGRWDEEQQTFVATLDDPNAVLVTGTAAIERPFGIVPGVDTVTHQAIAELTDAYAVEITSQVLSADTSRSEFLSRVMSRMFNGPVTLDAVGWNGMADVGIPLKRLMTELNVGSVDELLDAQITVGQLLTATANGLRADGEGLTVGVASDVVAARVAAAAEQIDLIVAAIGTYAPDTELADVQLGASVNEYVYEQDTTLVDPPAAPAASDNEAPTSITTTVTPSTTLRLGDVLHVDQGAGSSVASMMIDAQYLVTASAMLINGENVLDLDVGLDQIPGVSSGSLTMTVVEPPVKEFGRPGRGADGQWRTLARTAQLRFGLDDLVLDPIGTFGPMEVGEMAFPVGIDVGQGQAGLAAAHCEQDMTQSYAVDAVSTTVGRVVYGANAPSVLVQDTVSSAFGSSGGLNSNFVRIGHQIDVGGGVTLSANLFEIGVSGTREIAGTPEELHTLFGDFPTYRDITGADLEAALGGLVDLPDHGAGLTSLYDSLITDTTFDPVADTLTYVTLPDAPDGSRRVQARLATTGVAVVDISFNAETGEVTLLDPLLGLPLLQTNLVDDVLVPAADRVRARLQQIDERALQPLFEVLGVASLGDARVGNMDVVCGTRQLVR